MGGSFRDEAAFCIYTPLLSFLRRQESNECILRRSPLLDPVSWYGMTEKKKRELEKAIPSEIYKQVGAEGEWIDPRQSIVDPVEIAKEVARQLKRG